MNARPKEVTVLGRETIDQVWDEIQPLLKMHFAEIAHFPDIPLAPNTLMYRVLEDKGALRIFTARNSGKLIGYAIFLVNHSMHYSGSLQAHQDILFVDPAYRGSTVGYRLIRHCDAALSSEGVQIVFHHVKRAHPRLARLVCKLGYDLMDLTYVKRLDA